VFRSLTPSATSISGYREPKRGQRGNQDGVARIDGTVDRSRPFGWSFDCDEPVHVVDVPEDPNGTFVIRSAFRA